MARSSRPKTRRLLTADEISDYDHIADRLLEQVTIIQSKFLPNGADGLTIGRYVFVKPGHFDRSKSTLMAHELVHVRQFAEMGGLRFITAYVAEYLKHLIRLRSHREAYRAISFEVEAREVAQRWKVAQAGSHADPGSDKPPDSPAN